MNKKIIAYILIICMILSNTVFASGFQPEILRTVSKVKAAKLADSNTTSGSSNTVPDTTTPDTTVPETKPDITAPDTQTPVAPDTNQNTTSPTTQEPTIPGNNTDVTNPGTSTPGATIPGTNPDVTTPGTTTPGTTSPGTTTPDTTTPGTTPEATTPGTTTPGTTTSGTTTPSIPTPETPTNPSAPGTTTPGTPTTTQPGATTPGTTPPPVTTPETTSPSTAKVNISDILIRVQKYSETSNDEKERLCKYLDVTSDVMESCESLGNNLVDTINIIQFSEYGFTIEQSDKLLKNYDTIYEVYSELDSFKEFAEKLKLSQEKANDIKQLLANRYTMDEIKKAFIVAEALKVPISNVIRKKSNIPNSRANTIKSAITENVAEENKADDAELAEETTDKNDTVLHSSEAEVDNSESIINSLSKTYNIDSEYLKNYMESNNLSVEELQKTLVDTYLENVTAYSSLPMVSISSMDIQAPTTEEDINKELRDPFYNKEGTDQKVNLNTGGLEYENTILNLPGKNGLDFVLKAQYESDDSCNTIPGKGLTDIDYDVVIKKDQYKVIPGKGVYKLDPNKENSGYITDSDLINFYPEKDNCDKDYLGNSDISKYTDCKNIYEANEKAFPIVKDLYERGWTGGDGKRLVTYDDGSYVYRKYRVAFETRNGASELKDTIDVSSNGDFNKIEGRSAAGWHFNIPYIKNGVLHMSNGQTYEIDYFNKEGLFLRGYKLKDITIQNDGAPGDIGSTTTVIYKDGTREKFYYGKLKEISDRYGNKILFNESDGLTEVTDTVGRKIYIRQNNTGITITMKESETSNIEKTIGTLVFEKLNTYNDRHSITYNSESAINVISQYVDAKNRVTKYEYEMKYGNFSYFSDTDSQEKLQYFNLSTITYPSGAKTVYTYDKAKGILKNYKDGGTVSNGFYEFYRVSTKKDIEKDESALSQNTYNYKEQTIIYPGYHPYWENATYTTEVTDSAENIVMYTFDYTRNLLVEEKVLNKSRTLLEDTTYEYEYDKLVSSERIASYDLAGGVSTKSNNTKHNEYGDITEHTDELGNITTYEYYVDTTDATNPNKVDHFHMPKKVTSPIDKDAKIDSVIEYDVDAANGNILTETQKHSGGDIVTTYSYDTTYPGNMKSNTIKMEDGSSITTSYEYGSQYNGAYLTKKSTTVKNYDNKDETVSEEYGYDLLTGNMTSHTDGRANKTSYQYDDIDRLTLITYPGAKTKGIQYNDEDSTVTVKDEKDKETKYFYDGLGRQIETQQVIKGTWETISKTYYDKVGNIEYTRDGKNYQTSYVYDALGRVTKVSYHGENDSVKASSSTDYYDGQMMKFETNEDGDKHYYYYDEAGNLIKEEVCPIKGNNAVRYTTNYEYNSIGKVKKLTDARQNSTTYAYDDLGRLESVTNADGKTISYEYDNLGNVKTITSPEGSKTTRTYDGLGRLIKETDPEKRISYIDYDAAGNIEKVIGSNCIKNDGSIDNSKVLNFTYDNRNRLITKTAGSNTLANFDYYENGLVMTASNEKGIIQYEYLENGKLIKETRPNNKSIEYDYDENGNRKWMKDFFGKRTDYTYDYRNRLNTMTVDGSTTTYQYNEDGTRSATIYPGGNIKEEYLYDGVNNLINIKNLNGTTVINEYAYTYDQVGNQLTKDEKNRNTSYVYDKLNRVSIVKEDETQNGVQNEILTTYSYDGNGNITSKGFKHPQSYIHEFKQGSAQKQMKGVLKHAINYTYDQTDRLIQTRELVDGYSPEPGFHTGLIEALVDFTYDNNGNLLKTEKYGDVDTETATYTYDELDQLTQYVLNQNNQNKTTTFAYDANGTRLSKTYNNVETTYYNDGSNVIIEAVGDNLTARNIRGVNLIGRQDASGTTMYYLYNGHGDVVNLVDQTGNIKNEYDYDIYGKGKKTIENGMKNPVRYAGEYFDEESGLYYLRARYYDPEIMRFISEDTYKGKIEEPQSLNLYAYCSGNPIKYVDPTGHWNDTGEKANYKAPGKYKTSNSSVKNKNDKKNDIGEKLIDLWTKTPVFKALDTVAKWQDKHPVATELICAGAMLCEGGGNLKLVKVPGAGNAIKTPYGDAVQAMSKEALNLKNIISEGGYVYRAGQLGRSNTIDAQFWAPESPLNPGYAERYGVDFKKIDYIIRGKVKSGADFITRPAPGLGNNAGGAMEIVTNPNDVIIDSFIMP